MESIFSKAYRYRERENKNSLENYLIEIFSHCLQNDLIFQKSCLSNIGFENYSDIIIDTQLSYTGFGRPDIVIKNSDSIVMIECKIESSERTNQLKDYFDILKNSDYKNKYLIYLTKYYESKDFIDKKENIVFENFKWWDVYNLINDENDTLTKQLKIFLEENNIAMNKNFNTIDLIL